MSPGKTGDQEMSKLMIEDKDQFHAFLAAQPLCKWVAQKKQEIAAGMHEERGRTVIHPHPKDDNADLAAALSSMA
jgi:hypothetical protein